MNLYHVNRSCPISGRPPHRVLGYISAAEIGKANKTYRDDYMAILGIDPKDRFPIVQSTASGCIYAGWNPTDDFLHKLYEDVIDHSKTLTETIGYRAELCRLSAQVYESAERHFQSSPKPLRALDFGCGYGAILDILSCRDLVCYGYEPSMNRRKSAHLAGKNIFMESAQIMGKGPFDLVICTEVLEHLSEPLKALRFMKDNAHSQTIFAFTVPQCETRFVKDGLSAAGYRILPRVINPWEHLNYFSWRTLRRLLDQAGFEVIYDMGLALRIGFLPAERGLSRYKNIAGALKRILSHCYGHSTQVVCRLK